MRVLTAGAGILLCLFGSTTAATGQDRQQASLTERDRQGVVHLFVTGADRQPILDLRPEEVGKAVKVVTMFEPGDASQALTAAVVALYDDNGKMVARGTSPSGARSRAPVVLGLQKKPGTYRLRVAVADARGRCGTVDQPVEAVLAKAGPLSFSSLVLGTAAGGRFSPVLEFAGAASAIACLEVYGVSEDTLLDATCELVTSADGPAVATVPVDVRTGASPDLRIVLGEILLAALPPGDIVVRAVVGVRGQQPARVSRTLRRR